MIVLSVWFAFRWEEGMRENRVLGLLFHDGNFHATKLFPWHVTFTEISKDVQACFSLQYLFCCLVTKETNEESTFYLLTLYFLFPKFKAWSVYFKRKTLLMHLLFLSWQKNLRYTFSFEYWVHSNTCTEMQQNALTGEESLKCNVRYRKKWKCKECILRLMCPPTVSFKTASLQDINQNQDPRDSSLPLSSLTPFQLPSGSSLLFCQNLAEIFQAFCFEWTREWQKHLVMITRKRR